VPLAHPDEYLEGVITRMVKTNAAHVPVISRADARLVGYLSWRDLLRAWEQAQQQEVRRTLFYHFRRGANGDVARPATESTEKT
jgi:CBS domain-containing protein